MLTSHLALKLPTIHMKLISFKFIPEGGPRHCIGSKYAMLFMKTCLANFLRNYEIDTTLKYDELDFRVSVTLKINQPTKISLKRRHY